MSYSKSPEINYTSVNSTFKPWKPGAFRRIPWSGIGCIAGAVLGMVAAIAILRASDGAPIASWRYSPTVYLSISYTSINIFLGAAFSQGVTINWWRKSMKEGTELGDLHRYWDFGTSAFSALLAGRKFNFIAFACLFVAISPVNGPLLQRSSSVEVQSTYSQVNLVVPAAKWISDPTGWVSGRARQVPLLSSKFNPVVQQYYRGDQMSANRTGCSGNGMCTGRLIAAGLSVNCSSSTAPFDLNPQITFPNGSTGINWSAVQNGTDVFQANFVWDSDTPANISLNIQYKPTKEYLNSNLVVKNCTLHPATVQYPVVINGNKSTIALDPRSTIFDDVLISRVEYPMEDTAGTLSPMGGYVFALKTRFNSYSNLRWVGAVGYDLGSFGPVGPQFASLNESTPGYLATGQANVTFSDPTEYLLEQARELMFRTALAGGNSSSLQPVSGATEVSTVGVYRSHYLFLGLAVAITFLAILLILATFNGYWQLGRKVTMSPLEIGKAFNAHLLAQEDSNAEVKELVKGSGSRPVRYGQVADFNERSSGTHGGFMNVASIEQSQMRLEIADHMTVQPLVGSKR